MTDGISTVRSICPVPVLASEEKPGPGRPHALDDNRIWRASETVVTGNVIQGKPDGGQADTTRTGTIIGNAVPVDLGKIIGMSINQCR